MHGIGANSSTVAHPKAVLEAAFPGIYVVAMNVGRKGKENHDSWFMDINTQAKRYCDNIRRDPILRNAPEINLIGFSQGGLISRAYVQKCAGHNAPKVNTFISWVSPQGGQWGVPGLGNKGGFWHLTDDALTRLADCCIYSDYAQHHLSFAGYWKDPKKYKEYLAKSTFLADLNNERVKKNRSYKEAIKSLKHMALSYSLVDEILQPKENGWFESLDSAHGHRLVPLKESRFYREDWLGIRALDETGRLTRFRTSCKHGDYKSLCFDRFFQKYVIPLIASSNRNH